MSSIFDENHRSAIHLNNITVSLIERRCYNEAAKVLNDALKVLQMAIAGETTSPSELEHLVYRGSLYLHCDNGREDEESISSFTEEDEEEDWDACLDKETSCDDSFRVLNQYGEDMGLGDCSSSIRRKPIFYIKETRNNFSTSSADSTLALLLHNQGQLYRSLARSLAFSEPKNSLKLLDGAKTVFYLSRLILDELKTPISPMVAVAIHQTKLDMMAQKSLNDSIHTTSSHLRKVDTAPRQPHKFRSLGRNHSGTAKAA